jgi:phosphatidylserine/phosphatidylglycerophosphate/cardiolipin synthase-like enzyme
MPDSNFIHCELSKLTEMPPWQRPQNEQGHFGSLHVKCAVADDRTLFISSANLTEYALTLNMELGVLIQDGPLPADVNRHFEGLMEEGVLVEVR